MILRVAEKWFYKLGFSYLSLQILQCRTTFLHNLKKKSEFADHFSATPKITSKCADKKAEWHVSLYKKSSRQHQFSRKIYPVIWFQKTISKICGSLSHYFGVLFLNIKDILYIILKLMRLFAFLSTSSFLVA